MIIYVWKVLEGLVPNINNNIHANNNPGLGRKCITVSHTNKLRGVIRSKLVLTTYSFDDVNRQE